MPRRCHSGGMAEGEELQTDVLVVGAGPSGLMAAVCLARLGVDAVIVDGKDGPTRESRALAVQARSMELYDQLGLVDRVLAERSPATTLVPGAGSRPFGRIELRAIGEGVTPYRELTVFEQSRNERMLVDALADLGREVRWGHRLARLEIERCGAAATRHPSSRRSTAPDGPVTVRARYCVGADGAHSPVREALGVPFEGVTNAHTFYVADASGVTGLVDGAINVRITAEHFLLAFPMGPGRMRLLGVVRDRDLDAAGELREARRALDDATASSGSGTPGPTGSRPTACTIGSRSASASGRASSSAMRRTSTRRSARRA